MYYHMQGNLPTNLDCLPLGEHNPTLHKVLAIIKARVWNHSQKKDWKHATHTLGISGEQLTRKTSFEANIKDIFTRFLSQSDYFSVTQRKMIASKRNKKKPNLICLQQQLLTVWPSISSS